MSGASRAREPATILVVHERYRQGGGEDVVVAAETALLARHGHRVETLILDNDVIPDPPRRREQVGLAIGAVWSRSSVARLRHELRLLRPDVVHIHNTLPLLSPAIYSVCRREGVATVQTLHNYRLICPAATLFRDGGPCEDCVGKFLAWPGILHACYRGSRAQSATVAAMLSTHRLLGTWRRDVDRYIALTEFARDFFVRGGLPAERVAIKPNFVDPDPGPGVGGDGFLYAGRLAPEKGVATLVQAFATLPSGARCRIVGDGPLRDNVAQAIGAGAALELAGALPRGEVLHSMRTARAVIVPSTWYEMFGLTVVEAFASGRPVIASRIGTLAELVDDGRTGLHFRAGDPVDLARAVTWAQGHTAEMRSMGAAARREYEDRYTAEVNYPALVEIYRTAMESAELERGRHARPDE